MRIIISFAAKLVFIVFCVLTPEISISQTVFKGVVIDSLSKEPIANATIWFNSELATSTGKMGEFVVKIDGEGRAIVIKHIGYKNKTFCLQDELDQPATISLSPEFHSIEGIALIHSHSINQILSNKPGFLDLSSSVAKELPSLLGESDLFKAMQLLPGFQFIGEGDAAIYVRGGSFDQNLILLDGAPVYNPSHLLGFYSVFNSEVVDRVQLHKSGIPSEYGNRISSAIICKTNTQIPEKIEFRGNFGIISSNLFVKTPLLNESSMAYFAIRKSYQNLLNSFVKDASRMVNSTIYGFYDINAGAFFNLNSKNKITLSLYTGNDNFNLFSSDIKLKANMKWGNKTGSANWNYRISENLLLDQTIYYTRYGYGLDLIIEPYIFNLNSGVAEYGHNAIFAWYGSRHKIRVGTDQGHHFITPNTSNASIDSLSLDLQNINNYRLREFSLFASGDYEITQNISVSAGVRLNSSGHFGPYTHINYSQVDELSDTNYYYKNQLVKGFFNPDLTFSIRYLINNSNSFKLMYSSNYQYLHLIGVSSVTFPTDFWISAGKNVPPQYGQQFSGGYYFKSSKGIELSFEAYYKKSVNQSEYIGSIVNSMRGTPFYQNVVYGRGRSSGIEILIRRKEGRLNGWLGYSFSRSKKSIEEIENGRWFPTRFDRPHNLSLVANYNLNQKWQFSSTFVYYTGNSYTPIIGRYLFEHNALNLYGAYNSARFPDYHKLDLSATYVFRNDKSLYSAFVLSIYNAYNRKNPFIQYPKAFGNLESFYFTVEQQSIHVFPIIPSISWQVKF